MAKPETTFKAGAVRASVFVNTYQRNGQTVPIRKAVADVRYKDKNGEWQSTHSFSLNEIPKAITALQQAYEYMLSQGSRDASSPAEDIGQPSGYPPAVHEKKPWPSGTLPETRPDLASRP